MEEYRVRNIGPVVREDNPKHALEALNDGCSGVILAEEVPFAVTREVEDNLSGDPDELKITTRFDMRFYGPKQKDWSWPARPKEVLPKTCAWLKGRLVWAMNEKFRPPASRFRSGAQMILAAHGEQLRLPWHIDSSNPDFCDVHIHIYGRDKGLIVAAPEKTLKLTFNYVESGSHRLMSETMLQTGMPAEIGTMDQELMDQGVRLINLQPGEHLIFRRSCLHRSSQEDGTLKFRAAMF